MQQTNAKKVFNCETAMAVAADDVEFLREIVDVYLADVPTQIAKLQAAAEAGDIATAERQAHTIKGASSNIGAERVRAAALEIESAAKAGELDVVRSLTGQLEPTLRELESELDKFDWNHLAA